MMEKQQSCIWQDHRTGLDFPNDRLEQKMVSWMVSLVWKTWKGFSLAIAMIACRLIVLITYSSSMLACFALHAEEVQCIFCPLCVYCSDDHCLFTSEKVVRLKPD